MTGRSRLAASPPAGTSVTGFQGVVDAVVLLYRPPAVTQRLVLRRTGEDAPNDAPALRLVVHLPELVDVVHKLDGATRNVFELFHRGTRLITFLQTIREAAIVILPPTVLVELPLDNVVLRTI